MNRPRRRRTAGLLLTPLLLGGLPAAIPPAAAATAPAAACRTTAGSGPGGAGAGGQLGASRVTTVEAQLGQHLLYSRDYVPRWNAPIHVTPGHIPVLSISTKGTTWAAIAAGEQDGVIRRQAQHVAAIPGPVYLAFNHEPENDPGSPAQFTAAWRHYVALYRDVGVRNVYWTWILMADSYNRGGQAAAAYYPGDDAVDVVAADGYNWAGVRPGAADRSFSEVFAAFHTWAAARHKPALVAEFGTAAGPTQAQWVRNATNTIRSWPDLRAALWWNSRSFSLSRGAMPALGTLAASPTSTTTPTADQAAATAATTTMSGSCSPTPTSGGMPAGQAAATAALGYLGHTVDSNPISGCADLTAAAYATAGVALPCDPVAQWAATTPIPPSQARPGDLLVPLTAPRILLAVTTGQNSIRAAGVLSPGGPVQLVDVPLTLTATARITR